MEYRGPNRKKLRYKDFDYSKAGAYFVTTVTAGRRVWFGQIIQDNMIRNRLGEIVAETWLKMPKHYPHIRLGEWVVMPNHFHGIVFIDRRNYIGKDSKLASKINSKKDLTRHGLTEIMRAFKSFSSREINKISDQNPSEKFAWQRSYHDRIIRDEDEYYAIEWYILQNPAQWHTDRNRM